METSAGALSADVSGEWFNAWWDQTREPQTVTPALGLISIPSPHMAGKALAKVTRAALLARDIAEIEKVRDFLFAGMAGAFIRTKAREIPIHRSSGSGPVLLGTVLGILITAISTAAAAFMKFAR